MTVLGIILDPAKAYIFLIVFPLILAVAFSFLALRVLKINKSLRPLSSRLKGRFKPATLLREPGIQFTLAGRPAELEFCRGTKYWPAYTSVSVDLRNASPGRLHVLPRGFGSEFLGKLGLPDRSMGDAYFDSKYVVKAVPESLVARLFDPERRHQIMASVERLRSAAGSTIDLDRDRLVVRTREFIVDDKRLTDQIKAAEDVLGGLLLGPVTDGKPGEPADGHCPVCDTALVDRLLQCAGCGTSHHAECWSYVGRCSGEGCRGKRYRL